MVVLDLDNYHAVYTDSFDYGGTFPEYETEGGVLFSKKPEIRHTSPFMLIEALDFAFSTLDREGVDLSLIQAIKIDGMQHCTVYADPSFGKRINSLSPEKNLLDQIGPAITRKTSPIWEDRSPLEEAEYLTEFFKDKGGINHITGNRAELRFPAAQILKWTKESPDEYERTSNIFLLSAFLTSILAGRIAPVDTGDGWGTNLNHLDVDNPGWSKDVLSLSDIWLRNHGLSMPLEEKVGFITHYDAVVGKISRYFNKRFNVNPNATVLVGTGDNPATLLGCGGHAVISLGSSYTVNGVMKDIIPSSTGEYNIFGYTPGNAMALSVFTNGGKVHDYFLKKYITASEDNGLIKESWDSYVLAAGDPLLAENENLMLPFLQDESVPLIKKGIVRDGFGEDNANANIRALTMSQALSLKLHSGHLGDVDSICIVGGGSGNRFLNQIISDVFNAKIYRIKNAGYAAPFGCAISGAKSVLGISYDEAAEKFVEKDESSYLNPIKENIPKSRALCERYKRLERKASNLGIERMGSKL